MIRPVKRARRGRLAFWFVPTAQTRPVRVALSEGGYLGAVLVIGGIAVLLGVYSRQLTDVVGGLVLAALTVVLGGSGLAVAGGPRNLPAVRDGEATPRRRLAGLLFALAAGSASWAVGILARGHVWFAASAVGLAVALLGYALLRTMSGLLAGTALSIALAVSTVHTVMEPTPLSVGVALVAVGALLGLFSVVGVIKQVDLGLGIGAVVALVGAQQPLARAGTVGWAYALTFAVALACFALYPKLPATVPLVVGVIGVGLAVLEMTLDLTSGPAGLAAALVATGATLVATSGLGMRAWRTRRERVARARNAGRPPR